MSWLRALADLFRPWEADLPRLETCAERDARDWAEASQRWAARNAALPRVCPCGQPGVTAKAVPPWWYVGDVSPIWWRCEQHRTVPAWGRPT